MITVTRDIQAALRRLMEEEYNHRRTVGNRSLEQAMVQALQSSPVRETISVALDIFLDEIDS
jgi:hypothetical protein